jgi:hypothetical protein
MSASALKGDLLAGRCPHRQVPDLLRILEKLRLHAHHQIEELFALRNLRRGLAAERISSTSFCR